MSRISGLSWGAGVLLPRVRSHSSPVHFSFRSLGSHLNVINFPPRLLFPLLIHSAPPPSVTLRPDDEFLILGCDGIWDCLTNEEAVRFVRTRIDEMTPAEIGAVMLDEIVSKDPRVTQGIGGDNMTILIVDLLPGTRPYNNRRKGDGGGAGDDAERKASGGQTEASEADNDDSGSA